KIRRGKDRVGKEIKYCSKTTKRPCQGSTRRMLRTIKKTKLQSNEVKGTSIKKREEIALKREREQHIKRADQRQTEEISKKKEGCPNAPESCKSCTKETVGSRGLAASTKKPTIEQSAKRSEEFRR
ncbi:23855_t:CDS:2, partial [Gigaspora rosea]